MIIDYVSGGICIQKFNKISRKFVLAIILISLIHCVIADRTSQSTKSSVAAERICEPWENGCSGNGPSPSAQVFYDDFEGGPKSDWDLPNGWAVKKSEGNYVLRGLGHKFAVLRGHDVNNLAFKAKFFKKKQGGLHINFRSKGIKNGINRYFVSVDNKRLALTKQLGDNFDDVAKTNLNLDWTKWHWVEIRAKGDSIRVIIDNKCCICYKDSNPINTGGVSFETLDDSEFLIDEVSISKL